jgi:hypothetical protein
MYDARTVIGNRLPWFRSLASFSPDHASFHNALNHFSCEVRRLFSAILGEKVVFFVFRRYLVFSTMSDA